MPTGVATMVEWEGRAQKLSALCARFNIAHETVLYRLKHGWLLSDALTKPSQRPKAEPKPKEPEPEKAGPPPLSKPWVENWTQDKLDAPAIAPLPTVPVLPRGGRKLLESAADFIARVVASPSTSDAMRQQGELWLAKFGGAA